VQTAPHGRTGVVKRVAGRVRAPRNLTLARGAGSLHEFITEPDALHMPDFTPSAESAFAARAAGAGLRASRRHAVSPPVVSPVVSTVVSPPVASPPCDVVVGVAGAYPPVVAVVG